MGRVVADHLVAVHLKEKSGSFRDIFYLGLLCKCKYLDREGEERRGNDRDHFVKEQPRVDLVLPLAHPAAATEAEGLSALARVKFARLVQKCLHDGTLIAPTIDKSHSSVPMHTCTSSGSTRPCSSTSARLVMQRRDLMKDE